MYEFVAQVSKAEPTVPVKDPSILVDSRAATDDGIRYTSTEKGIPQAVLLPDGEKIKVVAKKIKISPQSLINAATPIDREVREARVSYQQWRSSTMQLITEEFYQERTMSPEAISNTYVDNYLLGGSFLAYVWDKLGGKAMSRFYDELTKPGQSVREMFVANLKMLPADIRSGIAVLKQIAHRDVVARRPAISDISGGLNRAMRESELDSVWATCLQETQKLLTDWEAHQKQEIAYLTLSIPEWETEIKGMVIGKFQEGADEWLALRQAVAAIHAQHKELGMSRQRKDVTVLIIADDQELPPGAVGGNELNISALSRKARHDGLCNRQRLIVIYPYQYSRTWDDRGITIDASKILKVIQHEMAHQGDVRLNGHSTTTAQCESFATASEYRGNFDQVREALLQQDAAKAEVTPEYLGTVLCGEGGIALLKKRLLSVFGKTAGFSPDKLIADYIAALHGGGSSMSK
ncbi:MAG: hypothetical protein WC775_05855 [Patescibacteria group bacterium]|jgi:hypothetical protein